MNDNCITNSIKYIGVNGNVINLFQSKWFCLTHADGLTSVSSSIASSTTPGMDGDKIKDIELYFDRKRDRWFLKRHFSHPLKRG